jgi:chromosome segregation ATPase
MSIRKILKDGLTEMRRKSRLYGLKRSFTKKENEHSEKLIVLGNKAWETRPDMGPIGNLDEVLTQTEEEGKNITAQLQDLNTRETELQEKLKAEKSRFDVEFKDLESKKTPIDLELKQEKDKQKNSQKDSDSIQKRLQHIPKDEEKIKEKMSDSQDDSQLQAEYKKKILSLQEEKELLTQNFQNLSKIIQTSDETIVPLEEQSQLLQEKIKKTKAHHKEEINNLNKALSEVKRKISNLKAKNKEVSQKQDQHFLALGKKLIESKIKNEILSSQLEEVKNIEQEINFIQQDIQSLENRNRYASRWAIWKFVGLVCLFLLVIVGITLGAVWLSKSILRNERSANIAQSETPQNVNLPRKNSIR